MIGKIDQDLEDQVNWSEGFGSVFFNCFSLCSSSACFEALSKYFPENYFLLAIARMI